MSFGRKGLAPGEVAPAPSSGFGRAGANASAAQAAPVAEHDDLAAKREAFIASERARAAGVPPAPTQKMPADPLVNLRNRPDPEPSFMQGAARPAQPLGHGVAAGGGAMGESMGGSGQMSAQQEEEIRQAARSMAAGGRSYSGGSLGTREAPRTSYFFGDPASRTLGIAYVLWFVLGQFSLHRFYCGQKDSAIIQVALWVFSIVTLFIFPPFGLIGLLAWICWIIGDLFMIPGMLKKFQAEHDYRGIFA